MGRVFDAAIRAPYDGRRRNRVETGKPTHGGKHVGRRGKRCC